jgi:pimeloyl-ACP methyl ester carboxylesterase
VLIGHSLGSVVAYEALCAHPEWAVHTFVTLGSPLGIRNLIFDYLRPPPKDGLGSWPGSIRRWANISDRGDVVALVKGLAPFFSKTGSPELAIRDASIDNGATAHNIELYLTAEETGNAIAAGL